MEVKFYYISLRGTKNNTRIKESSNYRGSNYGDSTIIIHEHIVVTTSEELDRNHARPKISTFGTFEKSPFCPYFACPRINVKDCSRRK